MKTRMRFVLTLALVVPSWALAQEGPPAPEVTDAHKMLQRDVGTWEGEMKMWMQGPDSEPMVMPVKEINVAMEGDLWLISDFESGPFKGKGQFGYDPIKDKYVGTWIDNMSPHMSVMSGTYDKEKQEMVMYSKSFNVYKQKEEFSKSVSTFVDDKTKTFVMYTRDSKDDEWVKAFEIKYTKNNA